MEDEKTRKIVVITKKKKKKIPSIFRWRRQRPRTRVWFEHMNSKGATKLALPP